MEFLPTFNIRSIDALLFKIKDLSEKSPDGQFNAIMFKDKAKVGRNFTIELLEFLDRKKITLRIGDYRELVASKNVLKLMNEGSSLRDIQKKITLKFKESAKF